ncbi:MAG: carboxylating nicotinate-nucleotide diphosphorylase [Methanotrichaceae archaeon]|nr:carboxylating nicotinate-nucleotide diphosphorylase [Methanotrichaceae archaeon]
MLGLELERFIYEDLGEWDDSSNIVPNVEAKAIVIAKENCIIAGLSEACQILRYFGLKPELQFDEGECVTSGASVISIVGDARLILQSERLVLNFISRMSGISTLAHECVIRASRKASHIRVACTRKTTPGFRLFEKKAVFLGGGDTHRFNLSDAVLIKDNHIKVLGLDECIQRARLRASFTKKIEVEVENLEHMLRAAELDADIIMFDNMKPLEIRRGVQELVERDLRDRVILEASGGITLENIEDYASTGVDVISMGALTQNARWIDFSLEMMPFRKLNDIEPKETFRGHESV